MSADAYSDGGNDRIRHKIYTNVKYVLSQRFSKIFCVLGMDIYRTLLVKQWLWWGSIHWEAFQFVLLHAVCCDNDIWSHEYI